jgi:nitroimidazol reductase NimA-like FMN-containing flavoprotein (pyridoxamine 5'-phosphate oxidase superfamily)
VNLFVLLLRWLIVYYLFIQKNDSKESFRIHDPHHHAPCHLSLLKKSARAIFIKKMSMIEILSDQEIMNVVSNSVVGRLGCHADGKTYVVPISFAYDSGYIYARTFEGMKIEMMRKNPEVCFQVDDMQSMADWKSVILWGAFEELKKKADREMGLKILLSRILPNVSSETVKFTPEWPFASGNLSEIEGIVFRIRVREMSGRMEKPDVELYINW